MILIPVGLDGETNGQLQLFLKQQDNSTQYLNHLLQCWLSNSPQKEFPCFLCSKLEQENLYNMYIYSFSKRQAISNGKSIFKHNPKLSTELECCVFIKRLSNSMYSFTPVFYVFVRAPVGVKRVVSLLLRRDPFERITADIAVTMLTLVLWAPPDWLHSKHVSVIDIHR